MNQGVNMVDQERLVDEIKSLSDSIRRKHRALRLGVSEREQFLESTFKPVVGPLTEISRKLDNSIVQSTDGENVNVAKENSTGSDDEGDMGSMIYENDTEDSVKDVDRSTSTPGEASNLSLLGDNIATKGVLGRKYLVKMLHQAPSNSKYHVYGARMTDRGLVMGNSKVEMDNDDNLSIGGKTYEGTKGLFELIFKQTPSKYTAKDLKLFKKICQETNAHKKHYSSDQPIHRNRSSKYNKIISVLFPPKVTKSKRVTGDGLKTTQHTNIIYYNNINKLVDRLRVLYEAVEAGHTGLDNEIVALTEELRNRNVIE